MRFSRTLLQPSELPEDVEYEVMIVEPKKNTKQLSSTTFIKCKDGVMRMLGDLKYTPSRIANTVGSEQKSIDKIKLIYNVIACKSSRQELKPILEKKEFDYVMLTTNILNEQIQQTIPENKIEKTFYVCHGMGSLFLKQDEWSDHLKLWNNKTNFVVADKLLKEKLEQKLKPRAVKLINALPQFDHAININKNKSTIENTLLIILNRAESKEQDHKSLIILEKAIQFFCEKYDKIIVKYKKQSLNIETTKDNVIYEDCSDIFNSSIYDYLKCENILNINYGTSFIESLIVNNNKVAIFEPLEYDFFKKYKTFQVIKSEKEFKNINFDKEISEADKNKFIKDQTGKEEIISFSKNIKDILLS